MNRSTEAFVGTKDGDDDFAGILGRFTKYIFTPNSIVSFPDALHAERLVAYRVLTRQNTPHYNSSKMNGSALLPESKRPYFFIVIPFSLHRETKQYCFTLQTILFEEPNTSVWHAKQYCLGRQTLVLTVNLSKYNEPCRRKAQMQFNFSSLVQSIFQKCALAENGFSGKWESK